MTCRHGGARWLCKVMQVKGAVWKMNPRGEGWVLGYRICNRITVDLGRIAYLWKGVGGLLENHPGLHPHLKQAANTQVSVTCDRVSSILQLCWQSVGRTEMEKV